MRPRIDIGTRNIAFLYRKKSAKFSIKRKLKYGKKDLGWGCGGREGIKFHPPLSTSATGSHADLPLGLVYVIYFLHD
jgi:hypothetical protein